MSIFMVLVVVVTYNGVSNFKAIGSTILNVFFLLFRRKKASKPFLNIALGTEIPNS